MREFFRGNRLSCAWRAEQGMPSVEIGRARWTPKVRGVPSSAESRIVGLRGLAGPQTWPRPCLPLRMIMVSRSGVPRRWAFRGAQKYLKTAGMAFYLRPGSVRDHALLFRVESARGEVGARLCLIVLL